MSSQLRGSGDANGGLINRVYQEDYNNGGDLDRIDVITASSSSHSDLHSTGSQNVLTSSNTCYRFTNNTNCAGGHIEGAQETIELMGSAGLLRKHRSNVKSSIAVVRESSRSATPTNMVRRWSQNLARFSKNKRNSLREKTIYRLPSRKIVEVDGKLLSATSVDPEAEIEMLIKEIEQHDSLMQDNALGEQNRLGTLRALPQSLATKRLLKRKLTLTIEQHSIIEQTPAWRKRLWRLLLFALVKIWTFVCLICNGVEIWYDALKTIEGHFGSNMSSYFKFLRWLFVLNIILFICTFGFITLPQMLHARSGESYTKTIQVMALTQETLEASNEDLFKELSEQINKSSRVNSKNCRFLDLLTGEGSLKSSLVFYGSYTNETFTVGNPNHTYSLPYAYYMTMLILYLSTFVVISTSMARSYRKSFIETSGGTRSMYAQKVFCSWDFGISNRKAAQLKHFGIYTEIKQILCELGELKQSVHILWRIMIFCLRLVAHLLVTAMIAGLGIVIWILLKKFGDNDQSSGWSTLYVPSVVNLSMLLLQMILSWIANMEDYRSPRRTLHIMLLRNFMLEFVVIGVLVYFLLTKKYGECWETSVGQEIYRLIIMDSALSLLLVPLVSCIRVFVIVRIWPQCVRPEFDISQRSLGLVFNQTLLWVGLFFAPLLAAIMVVKMVLMFYINKAMLLYLCKSPRHVWRSAQTHTLYLVFTFLSLLGVIITLGFIMTQVPVSAQCGPFRDYVYMFQIFIDGVLKLRQNHTLWIILMTLIRPAAVGGLLIIMAIMVYYLRAKSLAHCTMVKILKDMIYLEVKDKEYLLTQITNITKSRDWPLEEQNSNTVNGALASSLEDIEGIENSVLRSRNV